MPAVDEDAKVVTLLRDSDLSLSASIDAAEQIAHRLRYLSESTGPLDLESYFYTRIRVKNRASIIEKVTRKRNEEQNPYYSFRNLTDIIGFRIVTLFDDQISLAIESVLKIVEAGQRLSQALFEPNFLWNGFYDARFVGRGTGSDDIYSICHVEFWKRVASDFQTSMAASATTFEEDVKKRSPYEAFNKKKYSSAHLTFFARAYLKTSVVLIPIEFQVRAVSEDIWSEINHKFLYKLRSYYAWHPKFSQSFAHSTERSEALKEATDRLSIDVAKFRSSSIETRDHLLMYKSPKTNYNFSFCISIFDELGMDYTTHYSEQITAHSKNITKLNTIDLDTKAAAELIKDSIDQMNYIFDKIKDDASCIAEGELPNDTLNQKLFMLQFEIIRLKYILHFYTGYKISESKELYSLKRRKAPSKTTIKDDSTKEYRELFMQLYAELCNIKGDKNLLIRPIAVIHFWKHLISKEFSDLISSENLKLANEHIDDDITLPTWSIYHVIIPNRLAALLFEEAAAIEVVRASLKAKGSRTGLDNEIRSKITEALRWAVKAANRHSVYDPKRGDLIFRAEKHVSTISEGAQVLEIISFHSHALQPSVVDIDNFPLYAGIPVANLLKILDATARACEDNAARPVSSKSNILSRINEVKGILSQRAVKNLESRERGN